MISVKSYLAKDLMVPITEYATVSIDATLSETVLALEKAQEEFTNNRYSHRAVLVMNKEGRVVGKLSQLDFLRALEGEDDRFDDLNDVAKFGFSTSAVACHQEVNYKATHTPREDMLQTAANLKVADCMHTLSRGEYVDEDTSLETAIHQLITEKHLSLLVTKGKDIVGILRLSDVFAATFHAMKDAISDSRTS